MPREKGPGQGRTPETTAANAAPLVAKGARHELLERAVAAGHGEHSISSLVEVLKKPARAES